MCEEFRVDSLLPFCMYVSGENFGLMLATNQVCDLLIGEGQFD